MLWERAWRCWTQRCRTVVLRTVVSIIALAWSVVVADVLSVCQAERVLPSSVCAPRDPLVPSHKRTVCLHHMYIPTHCSDSCFTTPILSAVFSPLGLFGVHVKVPPILLYPEMQPKWHSGLVSNSSCTLPSLFLYVSHVPVVPRVGALGRSKLHLCAANSIALISQHQRSKTIVCGTSRFAS